MAKIVGIHTVRDFNTWKPLYDADEPRRSQAGMRTLKISTGKCEPNRVYMYWEVNDMNTFEKMLHDPELKKKMQEAGVTSPLDYCVMEA